jgi:hypothetical protein
MTVLYRVTFKSYMKPRNKVMHWVWVHIIQSNVYFFYKVVPLNTRSRKLAHRAPHFSFDWLKRRYEAGLANREFPVLTCYPDGRRLYSCSTVHQISYFMTFLSVYFFLRHLQFFADFWPTLMVFRLFPSRSTYRDILVGLLGRVIGPTQGLYRHRTTQHRNTRTQIHAPRRIRTCDPNVRAVLDSTCLRPLSHWDRLLGLFTP